MTTDDVLLHSFQIVDLATDGSLVEHLGRLLERSGRHEALGLQGDTGDALEYLGRRGRDGITRLNELEVAALEH